MLINSIIIILMLRRRPRFTRLTHSFPTRRSSDLLPRLRGEPADKGVGVKAGRRGQRQDVAVLDIDHNGRSLSFGRQSPHYGFLEPKIQRRRDVSAGNGGFARKLADWAPDRKSVG